jgi:hypothetical protein
MHGDKVADLRQDLLPTIEAHETLGLSSAQEEAVPSGGIRWIDTTGEKGQMAQENRQTNDGGMRD